MISSRRRHAGGANIEWFIISYRTIAFWLFLLGALGGVAYYLFHTPANPKVRAQNAISQAEEAYARAKQVQQGEGAHTLLEQSGNLLLEAKSLFEQTLFDPAEKAGLQSLNFANRILEENRTIGRKNIRFISIEGPVEVKRIGEFRWIRAAEDMLLNEGDLVQTSASASANLLFYTGDVFNLKTGSTIEIKRMYEHPVTKTSESQVKVLSGTLSLITTDKRVGSYQEVVTVSGRVRIDNKAKLEVRQNESTGKTEARVFHGSAKVQSGTKEVVIRSGEKVAFSSKRIEPKQRLPRAPHLHQPANGKIFIGEELGEEGIVLRWQEINEAIFYRIQIATSGLFASPLLDKGDLRGNSARLPSVENGVYYWRISSVNSDGLESEFRQKREFLVISRDKHQTRSENPPELVVSYHEPFGRYLLIQGRTEPGVLLTINGQQVDVDENGSFRSFAQFSKDGMETFTVSAQDQSGNEQTQYIQAFHAGG